MADAPNWITAIDEEMLGECLRSNDDLGVVLRTHLEIERAMIRVLEQKFPNYDALRHDRFSQHIRSLRALGATGPLFQVADVVNQVRNEMAHVKKGVRTKLSSDDLEKLRSQANGMVGRDIFEFTVSFPGAGTRKLRDCSLSQQFTWIGFLAAAAIDTISQREVIGTGK